MITLHSTAVPSSPMFLPDGRRTRIPGLTAAAVAIVLGCGGCGEPSSVPADGTVPPPPEVTWPMTRGGPGLGGRVPGKVPRNPAIAWTFKAASPVTAEGAIADGRIYVGTSSGVLHCLAADDGRELWRFATQDAITAAPAVGGGLVFLASNDGNLYALDGDGIERWRFTIEDKISSGAIVIPAPRGTGRWVLVNGYDGSTRALQAEDGRVIWTYQTNDFINGAPALVDGRFVVFGGCDAQLHVVNVGDGTLVHTIPTEAYIPSSIGTFGAMAYCGNYANQAVAFDVLGGRVAWTYEDRPLPFFSSPAVDDRLVLIGSRDKHLHAIRRATGEPAWKFPTGGRVEGSPVLFEDGVVFGSSDGRIYAAGLLSGDELWRLDLGESVVASVAFGGGLLIAGGEKGTIYAVHGRSVR